MAFDFPNIDPIALEIGPLVVRWYALAYIVGFVAGWRYCVYLADKKPGHKPDKLDIDDFLPWAVLGVILGGRLGYILFYQAGFYLDNPAEMLKVWKGGMSFHGGISGVIIGMIIYSRKRGFGFFALSDLLACATPIGLFFGRIANFVNGELYGRVTDVAWAVKFPHGGDVPRHPSQLYEAALEGLVLFIILIILAHIKGVRERVGILSGVFVAGYGVARFVIEFYREPDMQIGLFFDFISMGQILCLPMIIGGIGIIIYALQRHQRGNKADVLA
jgi:phosphatidylglycerol---prolipoprotein diacylglyceryl transferase